MKSVIRVLFAVLLCGAVSSSSPLVAAGTPSEIEKRVRQMAFRDNVDDPQGNSQVNNVDDDVKTWPYCLAQQNGVQSDRVPRSLRRGEQKWLMASYPEQIVSWFERIPDALFGLPGFTVKRSMLLWHRFSFSRQPSFVRWRQVMKDGYTLRSWETL